MSLLPEIVEISDYLHVIHVIPLLLSPVESTRVAHTRTELEHPQGVAEGTID